MTDHFTLPPKRKQTRLIPFEVGMHGVLALRSGDVIKLDPVLRTPTGDVTSLTIGRDGMYNVSFTAHGFRCTEVGMPDDQQPEPEPDEEP